MAWSPQQEAAIRDVKQWLGYRGGPQVFRLFGYAGTGKTTLAKELAGEVRNVLYGAFTGKAAHVLQGKGCVGAATIHSMIYMPDRSKGQEPKFILDPESQVRDADLVIIDEVSMVDEALARDLLSFGTRILVLGDPQQLPPVKGEGYFTDNVTPEVMLTEVHRQAAENPIIRMSMDIRAGKNLDYGTYGDSKIISAGDIVRDEVRAADQILVGRNRTRETHNARMRQLKGLPPNQPAQGDKLICLKNDKEKGFLNGSLWTVTRPPVKLRDMWRIVLTPEGSPHNERVDATVREEFFNGTEATLDWRAKRSSDQFTFGYALTVHKSQGSQWDNVYLWDESWAFREHRDRWLYTAVTRAAERITIVM